MNVLNEYIAATNTHDFDNLNPLVADAAVYYFSNTTVDTRQAIREYFENAWATIVDEYYSATDVECITSTETVCVYLYTYNYEGFISGKFVRGSGRATNVFQYIDNRWQLVHEHLSAKPSI
ncbi:nuclear transport factor 2 family protein [Erysipelothrix sp. HDW6C]|uniref:YybH family protein n=1 Tax=Erysipelothrix sp. HDW6C TaxID=2714930 RepID=UPI00140D2C93|nr:nuclear transport factor 2 family protein [Erysipelothrix sp. HDW6C]QIK69475.1 nuclear transport factor 2 family protein [Erysipelothrix sp. HDW6C]